MDQRQDSDPYDKQTLIERLESEHNWSDIPITTPTTHSPQLYQNIVPIIYHRLYEWFRFIMNTNELSPRVADLTRVLLIICSSDYYALMVRSQCKVQKSKERHLLNYLLDINSKEYHLWNYRKGLFEDTLFAEEIWFLQRLLEDDNKNYHVWSYRTWLVDQTKRYEQEFENVTKQIQTRRRLYECYSIWSYRQHLIQALNKDRQFVKNEIGDLLKRIDQSPENQCLWNILNGYFGSVGKYLYKDYPEISSMAEKINNRFSKYTLLRINKQSNNKVEQNKILADLIVTDEPRKTYWAYLNR